MPLRGVDDGVELGVGLERLDGGQREERQERQLDALAGLERGLGPVAQPGDGGDIGLDHGGQLGRGLQRLDHALGDDLPGAGHPLGGAAQARLGDRGPGPAQARVRLGRLARARPGRARPERARPGPGAAGRGAGGGGGRRRGPPGPGGVQHVLLADPAADTGPGHAGQVDAVLGGQLADQRGDVRALGSRWRHSWRPAPPRARRPQPPAPGARAAEPAGAGGSAGYGCSAGAGAPPGRRSPGSRPTPCDGPWYGSPVVGCCW